MDADVVFDAMAAAVDRARSGGGPTFIEFSTYRYYGHHTFELKDRLRYREEEEIERWRQRDPLALQESRVPAGQRAAIDAEVEKVLDEAVRFALDSAKLDPAEAFDYHYASGLTVRPGVAKSRASWAGASEAASVGGAASAGGAANA
jgi:pyruvate dehydrogenase E1 component alpha subunit